jgi:hypothetical protein
MSDTRSSSLYRSRSVGDPPIPSSSQDSSERANNETRATSSLMITIPSKRPSAPHTAHPSNSYPVHRPIASQSTTESSVPPITQPSSTPSPPQATAFSPTGLNPMPTIQPSNVSQDHPPVRPYQPPRSRFSRMMLFLGYGRDASRTRRLLVSLIWNVFWGSAQV